jgi:hypothetical protein
VKIPIRVSRAAQTKAKKNRSRNCRQGMDVSSHWAGSLDVFFTGTLALHGNVPFIQIHPSLGAIQLRNVLLSSTPVF